MAIPYLNWLAAETPTAWWHDSGDPLELSNALTLGACGVTTNPILTAQALRSTPQSPASAWRSGLAELDPRLAGEEKAIALLRLVACHAAERVLPMHAASGGAQGYACAQVNPNKAGDREAMLALARRFHAWGPNIAVKLPVTAAGLDVLEECVAEGITVTATVSFTLPQVIAAAERHRRGAARAQAAGIQAGRCFAVIMIGRLDDYLREVAWDGRAALSEADIRQAGLAVTLRAAAIFEQRQYSAVLLVAALRGAYHMTGLAGTPLVMSIHPKIQTLLAAPDLPRATGTTPVHSDALARLQRLPEFVRAYEPDGLQPDEFISYGVTQRTLASFIESGWGLLENYDLSQSR